MKRYMIHNLELLEDTEIIEFIDADTLQLISFTKDSLKQLPREDTCLVSDLPFISAYSIYGEENLELIRSFKIEYESSILKRSYDLGNLQIYINNYTDLYLLYENTYYEYEDCNPSLLYISNNVLTIYTDRVLVEFPLEFSLGGKRTRYVISFLDLCDRIEYNVSVSEFRKRLLLK